MKSCDFLIIGGGILGLSIALELKKASPSSTIQLIEKEQNLGLHASSRNSGVLHAGFYYTPDSLKAKWTRLGNQILTDYCQINGIPILRCGKLVVPTNEEELSGLNILAGRARKNKVVLEVVTADEAKKIEPHANAYRRALFSPTTSVVNPKEVIQSLEKEAEKSGIQISRSTLYLNRIPEGIQTSSGPIESPFVINASGLYADKIAMDFGFSKNYRILPFKGLYLISNKSSELKTNIYPVPDIKQPFLGVHFTVTPSGKAKLGPNAFPAFWRENYSRFSKFNFNEFFEVTMRQLNLFLNSNFNYKKLAFQEIKKGNKKELKYLAAKLVKGLDMNQFSGWGLPGIRAQLVNIQTKSLVNDFVVEGDNHSLHILNNVSPGFTCAFPFARYLTERIKNI